MKIRKGFVSNSSSSSFVIAFKGDKTLEKCEKLIEETYGDILLEGEKESLGKKLYDILEPYDRIDRWWGKASISEVKLDLYTQAGCTIWETELDDNGLSDTFICPENGMCLEYEWQDNAPEEVVDCENNH